jgi:hypothetical protein
MKFWSIATAVRNPERLRNFLAVLKKLEFEIWDKNTQKKFQIMLVMEKFFGYGVPQFHKSLSEIEENWLESETISYPQAEMILNSKNYKGGIDMRGRQSYNPLKKMGFAYTDENKRIRISDIGKLFLRDDYSLSDIFFNSLLKWQYNNENQNLKPFIATLHLIKQVNNLCQQKNIKPKGVSRLEFAIFFLTLTTYKDIKDRAIQLLNFRKTTDKLSRDKLKDFTESYFAKHFSEFQNLSNAKDYCDNIIRCFRLTGYIYIRGNGWYIDLEPRKKVEIQSIIETDNASAVQFKNESQYTKYLGNPNEPQLPWQTRGKIKKIIAIQYKEITEHQTKLKESHISFDKIVEIEQHPDLVQLNKYKNYLIEYRKYLSKLLLIEESKNLKSINSYIAQLKNIYSVSSNRPAALEKSVVLGLNALDDAIEIKPNYPVGDDFEPTFTAPANVPDIECYYESFNSVCEVTLLTNRQQWYNEGQPVMRHVRDFEINNSDKVVYCLFIAPKLHRDTINTFWMAVKYEYEGAKQKIVPLTIAQFSKILCVLCSIKESGNKLTHNNLKELYDKIINQTQAVEKSQTWLDSIPGIIDNWKEKLVS